MSLPPIHEGVLSHSSVFQCMVVKREFTSKFQHPTVHVKSSLNSCIRHGSYKVTVTKYQRCFFCFVLLMLF